MRFFSERESKDLHYPFGGFVGLWAHLYCFGSFALGFDSKNPRICIILLMGLWARLLLSLCINPPKRFKELKDLHYPLDFMNH